MTLLRFLNSFYKNHQDDERNGAIPLKNLLDAQATTRNARLSLVQTKQSQYNVYVTLLQALGGSPIQQLP